MNSLYEAINSFLGEFLFLKNGTCPVCGKVLFWGDAFLCAECEKRKPLNNGPVCQSCGRALTDNQKLVCKHCRQEEDPFSGGLCLFHYQEDSRKMITDLKFKNRPGLAVYLGQEMGKAIKTQDWINKVDLIMPIPIHPERRKERGYNQSEKIAEGLAAELPENLAIHLANDNLFRSHNNPHQIGQSLKKRKENMLGVFDLSNPREVYKKNILLVDDVLTTGATLFEAAATLRDGGAGKIFIAVIAALDDQ
ncbi:ComF family protein [Eubacteriaceae bacterium ES3]|nr:ComF family protein [Eubacteriaceae bacterium ES3]